MSAPVSREQDLNGQFLSYIFDESPISATCLNKLQDPRKEHIRELVDLFNQLNSEDDLIVQKAEEILNYLQNQKICFNTIVLHSFPLWPVDTSTLKNIALDQSVSKNALLRKRAFLACSYLTTHGYNEGYKAAALVASKKMSNEDKEVQEEGFKYFPLLLKRPKPVLSQKDLVLAISIAERISKTDQWVEASVFFEMLVRSGQEEDIAQIEKTVLNLCASDNSYTFHIGRNISDRILDSHNNSSLVKISLQAANLLYESKSSYKRGQGLNLFLSLLKRSPASTIDPLLKTLETESKKIDAQICILQILKELLNSKNEVVLQRAKKDAPTLNSILNNLTICSSSYIRQQARELIKTRFR